MALFTVIHKSGLNVRSPASLINHGARRIEESIALFASACLLITMQRHLEGMRLHACLGNFLITLRRDYLRLVHS